MPIFIPFAIFATYSTKAIIFSFWEKENETYFLIFYLDWWINKYDLPSISLWLTSTSLWLFILLSDELSTLLICLSSMAEFWVLLTVCNCSTLMELEAGLLFCLTERPVNNCCPELLTEDSEGFADLYVVAPALWLHPVVFGLHIMKPKKKQTQVI